MLAIGTPGDRDESLGGSGWTLEPGGSGALGAGTVRQSERAAPRCPGGPSRSRSRRYWSWPARTARRARHRSAVPSRGRGGPAARPARGSASWRGPVRPRSSRGDSGRTVRELAHHGAILVVHGDRVAPGRAIPGVAGEDASAGLVQRGGDPSGGGDVDLAADRE